MIDLSTPDALLYDSAVLSSYIRKNTKESFGYIFFDNIDYITKLYNDNRMRDVTYKNILDTILCGSVYLGFDTYECPDCGLKRPSLIPANPGSALSVPLNQLNSVPFPSLP